MTPSMTTIVHYIHVPKYTIMFSTHYPKSKPNTLNKLQAKAKLNGLTSKAECRMYINAIRSKCLDTLSLARLKHIATEIGISAEEERIMYLDFFAEQHKREPLKEELVQTEELTEEVQESESEESESEESESEEESTDWVNALTEEVQESESEESESEESESEEESTDWVNALTRPETGTQVRINGLVGILKHRGSWNKLEGTNIRVNGWKGGKVQVQSRKGL